MKVDIVEQHQQAEQLLEIQSPSLRGHHFTRTVEDEKTLEALPDPVQRNIETIIELETEHGRTIPTHHRVLERIAASFGHPVFLYGQIVFVAVWWGCTYLAHLGILPLNFIEFNLRDDGLDVASLLISTGVLVYQSRQEQIAEERSHLMLQIDLLTEQKIGKIISLIEELRRDLPNVHDRIDAEAEQMQEPVDPQALLTALKESLDPREDDDEDGSESLIASPQTLVDLDKAPVVLPTHLGQVGTAIEIAVANGLAPHKSLPSP